MLYAYCIALWLYTHSSGKSHIEKNSIFIILKKNHRRMDITGCIDFKHEICVDS